MTPFDAFTKLMNTDRNSLSCLRGDLERIERLEKATHSNAVEREVHAKYLEALDTLLDLVAGLEGYDRSPVVTFDFKDLTEENPELPDVVDAHGPEEAHEEEATKRWVA